MDKQISVTVWNEFRHEKHSEVVKAIYPDGIHNAIKIYLDTLPGLKVRTATLDEPSHGLTDDVLNSTDVLLWWGHMAHGEVSDEIVNKVYRRVLSGMGLIVLHSGHASKIFNKLCGTATGQLKWREDGDKERLWVIDHSHPITQGIGEYIELEHEEVYGEKFEIPNPDELLFISWFEGGEVFRSGLTYKRGNGKIFYFRPGHESVPSYHNEKVLRVIGNAVYWAAPVSYPTYGTGFVRPLEKVGGKEVK
ncbi:MAG: trehalose utilization protein ThuA [Clostridiales bacterium]|nr:trehalose utilization protein ThuA [Clostridiales bacterium]